jgi:hypothetical protein
MRSRQAVFPAFAVAAGTGWFAVNQRFFWRPIRKLLSPDCGNVFIALALSRPGAVWLCRKKPERSFTRRKWTSNEKPV